MHGRLQLFDEQVLTLLRQPINLRAVLSAVLYTRGKDFENNICHIVYFLKNTILYLPYKSPSILLRKLQVALVA